MGGADQAAGHDLARFDVRALPIITPVLASLALLSAASLWYGTWTLGPPDNNWMGTLPSWLGGLEPLFAGVGVWLWWFARRQARRHGLRAWPAHVALIVCLAATVSWVVWMVWFSSPPV
jgi:hypothetical protein